MGCFWHFFQGNMMMIEYVMLKVAAVMKQNLNMFITMMRPTLMFGLYQPTTTYFYYYVFFGCHRRVPLIIIVDRHHQHLS